MNKLTFGLLLAVFAVLFIACQRAPEATEEDAMQKEEAPSTTAPAPTEPTAPQEAPKTLKLTKFTAVKSGTTATVKFGLKSIEVGRISSTVTVTLFYARQPVANKTIDVELVTGEEKDFEVVFEDYPQFSAFYVDSPNLVNPLNK